MLIYFILYTLLYLNQDFSVIKIQYIKDNYINKLIIITA